jgi:hypothetical protein
VVTNVPEKSAVPIFTYDIKMETAGPPKTFVSTYEATCHNPEYHNMNLHHNANLKSNAVKALSEYPAAGGINTDLLDGKLPDHRIESGTYS